MPAIQNVFLFIAPMGHYLNYGSVVLHDIISANRQAGQIITELIGDAANPEKTEEQLKTLQPKVFSAVGHGNSTTYTVESTAKFVDAESPKLELFKDKIVSLTSCLTAIELGPAIIDAGALVFMGYKDEFWFYIGDEAGTTHAVQSPFLATFQFEASLLRGKTTGEARKDQLAKYDEEIQYWTVGAGKDHPESLELTRILEINKSVSTFLGEPDVAPSLPSITMPISPMLPWAISLLALSAMIYREATK